MSQPEPTLILDLMDAFRRSKVLFAAVNFGIFDILAEGPLTAADVAGRLDTNLSATERLLEACFGLKLLEHKGGVFSNAPEADVYLRRSSPRSLAGYILYSNQALYYCWGNLEDAIREGTPRWEQTFGSAKPIFEHFFSTPEKMRTFTMGMHGLGLYTSPSVVRAFDLGEFRTMADLGAATGHLVIQACELYPQLRGIAFDMAQVVPLAEEFIAASPARDRLSAQAGDFFEGDLPAADLYSLGRILHDWGEDNIRLLLRRIYDALPVNGGLLIAEKLIFEDRSGPLSAHLQSLGMLIVTEGKERSLSEYAGLLGEAGFVEVEGRRTGTYLDAILARKREKREER
jgi:acetylserotonin N-methyltransferase